MLVARYAKLVPESSKECLIQIGAHEGHEAGILEVAGFRQIVWIEADPDTFKTLQDNIANRHGAKHTTHNALITATSGEHHRFYRYSNKGASSSLYQPTDLFKQAFEGVAITDDYIDLPSISLDDFIRSQHLAPSALIIDVQGAELEVLKGGEAALKSASIVEVEISQQTVYEGGALFQSVDELLRNCGFTRVTHVPWHGDVLYVRIENFDLKNRTGLLLISSQYAAEYYSAKVKRFIPSLFTRPKHTLRKLVSRMRRS
jgi:FkbM family methyltransferase